jgi:hypothetical protein
MSTFKEANQVRTSLKMKLSAYYWYSGSGVFSGDDDYYVVINVKKLDNQVRKIIPPVVDGISIKTEVE